MNLSEPDTVSIGEAAKILGLSPDRVRDICKGRAAVRRLEWRMEHGQRRILLKSVMAEKAARDLARKRKARKEREEAQ